MQITTLPRILTGTLAVFLCSCASSGDSVNYDVQSIAQTSTVYTPVPAGSVNVSSHPPQGDYSVIAELSVTARAGESPTELIQRLQQKGATLGANYVMVTSVSDKTYLTPQNLDAENPYLSANRSFYNTANSTATNDTNSQAAYMREVIKGQALKITSGSNAPNKLVPSKLWQLN